MGGTIVRQAGTRWARAYPSFPSHLRRVGASCDNAHCSECNACWGQLRSGGAAVPAPRTVVWDGMDPSQPPIITSAPDLVKCQLLISSCGRAGGETVAWARREIELIRNDNHRLSAFVRPEKVAVLSISQAIGRLKVENSNCLGGFPPGFTWPLLVGETS